jgi:hypothetical protein
MTVTDESFRMPESASARKKPSRASSSEAEEDICAKPTICLWRWSVFPQAMSAASGMRAANCRAIEPGIVVLPW